MKQQFERVYFEPRGHRECGGIFVQLVCGHVVVVPPRRRVEGAHHCGRCEERAAVDALLAAYLPPLRRAA